MLELLRNARRRLPWFPWGALVAILFALAFASTAFAAPPPPPSFQGVFASPGMCSPRGIGITPSADVYVGSDCGDPGQHLARFTSNGTFLGAWSFGGGYLGSPNGVAVDGSGNTFVTDYEGGNMRKFTSAGVLAAVFGAMFQPVDVAVTGGGDVLVLELGGRRLRKYTNAGAFIAEIGSVGNGPGQFQDPTGLGIDGGGRMYVADYTRQRIIRFLANGNFDMEFATTGPPSDVAAGPDGNIYVVRFEVGTVYQYTPSGVLQQTFGSPAGLNGCYRITIGPTGAMYVSEQYNNRVTMFQIAGQSVAATRTTFGRLKAMYR